MNKDKLVYTLEERIQNGDIPSLADFMNIEMRLCDKQDADLSTKIKLLKEQIYPAKTPTKWELLLAELSLMENIEPVWELAVYFENHKNEILTEQELVNLEQMLEVALPCLSNTDLFTDKQQKRIKNEFTKRIKTFKKRLESEFNKEFCKFIKEKRLSMGYSLKDVEDLTDISSSHLHRIENGNRRPSIRVIEKLSKVLEIPQSDFLKNMNIGIEKEDLLTIIERNQFLVNGRELSKDEQRQLKTYIKGFY